MNKKKIIEVFLTLTAIIFFSSCALSKSENITEKEPQAFKIEKIDSVSFDFYYVYTLKCIKIDSIYEIVVEKANKPVDVNLNVKRISVGDTCMIMITGVHTFKLKKNYSVRVGTVPIGLQKENLKMVTINNYKGIYTTKNLYSSYYYW